MTEGKNILGIILMMFVISHGGVIFAQNADETSSLVKEEMVLDDTTSGDLTLDDNASSDDTSVVEEPIAEEPAVDDVAADEKGADGMSVEDIAKEVNKADKDVQVAEQQGNDIVAEEPVAEEAPVDEAVAADENTATDTAVVAAEEPVAEEPVAEEAPVDEAVAADENVATDTAAVAAEEPVAEEPVAEEASVDEAVAADENAATDTAAVEEEEPVVEVAPAEQEETIAPPAKEQEPVEETKVVEVKEQKPAKEQKSEIDPEIEAMIASQVLARKAYREHAAQVLHEAEKALKDHHYKDARTMFENAQSTLDKIGRRPEDNKLRERAQKGLATTLYEWAVSLKNQKDLEAANQMARQAAVAGAPKAPALIGEIQEERKNPKPEPPPKEVARWKQDDYKKEKAEIAKLLRSGRQYYMAGEYGKADMEFQRILKRDPYNTEAIRMLQKNNLKRNDISEMEFRSTRTTMLKEVKDKWTPRTYALGEEVASEKTGETKPSKDDSSNRMRILNKMKDIVVPEIEFRQANINDVIDFLQQASRDYDTAEKDENKRGVNIILNLGSKTESAPAASSDVQSDDPFADTTSVDTSSSDNGGGVPLITFSARNISLLEALKLVTKVANLKYRIEDSVVMILPWNAATGDIVVRMYNVLPSVEERLMNVSRQLGSTRQSGSGGGGSSDFTAMESADLNTGGADWKKAFGDMGVQWPEGSSIKYVSAMGKLIVANTVDNLTVFERVLSELNVVPSQIEIESRFVEVGQKDLDALGFEWGLTDDWELAQKKGSAGDPLGGRQRIVMNKGEFTTGNRYLTDDAFRGLGVADNVLSIAGVLTNPELKVVLHALEQKGSTDLLSAPKVLTQSGTEATIKVVTEYIYPTSFTVTPITGTAQGGSGDSVIIGGIVEPDDFETREVGVILTVLPEVSPEGQMINLTMSPQVVSDPIWHNYGTTYTDQDGNVQQLNMEQPFFFTRSISTSIAVYNNATVVMGGMITEKHDAVNDRIPLLGDVPLLGKLFQSNYDHTEKRNLLIFVTARLVDPAGRPIKETKISAFN